MEYLWCAIAAATAGIGTGLAGLSAATAMVPILIVMCPSFRGDAGVYHAAAIALASDILGSAFTTGIYIKNNHIDLNRGWLMMVCIIGMCVVGSFVAFQIPNIVLGSFSLIMCVVVGIRFILKPDMHAHHPVAAGTHMTKRVVEISLVCGLIIGFGTGFVGSGGGMTMLIVFIVLFGMDQKCAVGTSTFIMTFTALIAFMSHCSVDPSIITKDWDILIICVIVETGFSIGAAQFANHVPARLVGKATGWCLAILGTVMLFVKFAFQV